MVKQKTSQLNTKVYITHLGSVHIKSESKIKAREIREIVEIKIGSSLS